MKKHIPKYTPEKFADLVEHYDSMTNDNEHLHSETDKLMEELLISLGYEDGIKLIREQTRWYA